MKQTTFSKRLVQLEKKANAGRCLLAKSEARVVTHKRLAEIRRKFDALRRAGQSPQDYLGTLADGELLRLIQGRDNGVDWPRVTDEDLDRAASSKMTMKELQAKYPAAGAGDKKE